MTDEGRPITILNRKKNLRYLTEMQCDGSIFKKGSGVNAILTTSRLDDSSASPLGCAIFAAHFCSRFPIFRPATGQSKNPQ